MGCQKLVQTVFHSLSIFSGPSQFVSFEYCSDSHERSSGLLLTVFLISTKLIKGDVRKTLRFLEVERRNKWNSTNKESGG